MDTVSSDPAPRAAAPKDLRTTVRLVPAEGVHEVALDGEVVLVDPIQGCVHSLDAVGMTVWSLLDGDRTISMVADACAETYAADVGTVTGDVLVFAEALLRKGLVVSRGADERRAV